jgi:hypothetical protein
LSRGVGTPTPNQKNLKKFKKGLDKPQKMWYNISVLKREDKKFKRLPTTEVSEKEV